MLGDTQSSKEGGHRFITRLFAHQVKGNNDCNGGIKMDPSGDTPDSVLGLCRSVTGSNTTCFDRESLVDPFINEPINFFLKGPIPTYFSSFLSFLQ